VFKSRAFKKSSQALQNCPDTITSEAQAKKLKIPGIGKGSLAVVRKPLYPTHPLSVGWPIDCGPFIDMPPSVCWRCGSAWLCHSSKHWM